MEVSIHDTTPTHPEPSYGGLRCFDVDAHDLPLLTRLGLEAFGEAGPSRYGLSRSRYYQRMFAINPSIYRVALKQGDERSEANAFGMLVVIPTSKITYTQLTAGNLSQFEFDERHILPRDTTKPCDVYVQTVYLRPGCRRWGRHLLIGLMSSLAEHSRGGVDGNAEAGGVRVYGEAVSDSGKLFIDAFQMTIDGRSRDGNPVYLIDTHPGKPLIIKTPHKLLNAELQSHATPGLVISADGGE